MTDRTDEHEKLRAAQEYFRSLAIDGWEETNSPVLGGGQATVLVVNAVNEVKGAFRFTKESEQKDLDRFFREIKILSEYEHPNILRILDYSKDPTQPWYISELGDSFVGHWRSRRQQLSDDPLQLVRDATEVVRQLSDGLATLHDKNIVHRDIKPANVILKRGSDPRLPVLIDFGLAYVPNEPRLSDVNETVGNFRFSPDVAMYHMENVLPWLDIHNLAQLFIWMTRVRPDKDWQRALDWRWVNYDDRLTEDVIHSIRALTAQCSEESIGPKNARELVKLIDNLFPRIHESPSTSINVANIQEGRRRGLAASSLASAENTRLIEASFPFAAKTFVALCQGLESLFADCRAASITVERIQDDASDGLRLRLLASPNNAIDMWLAGWEIGSDGRNFTLRIGGQAVVPSRRTEWYAGGGRLPPESFNPFFFNIHIFGPQTGGAFPSKGSALLLDNQGSLFVCDTTIGLGEIKPSSLSGIIRIVKEWIEDPNVWEALQKLNQAPLV